ncbi:hypothetical protein [Actinomadura sp. NEAU-AAG7]|uniref:hypothetical protein n=1 Tax=Actinomadura sp. NEAU-AAG7 TaxID=2839640 RepID=UPI001BE4060F|nr:hypothetical protein [Actinomadura sp. NEAU-AAG7]MBT2209681.1 hypothetical protein [Actinomadura sp. NEAU-AAG7]
MTDQPGGVRGRATAEDVQRAATECRYRPIRRATALGRAGDRRGRGGEGSGGFWAGTSDRSGPSRPEGSGRPQREDAWSPATAGDPTDIRQRGTRPCRDA